ncbi:MULTISPECIES: hypothetical protein [Maricaulis]|uniref:Lipoprotein n=1 Tax=Maricaulis maris TaxID=74318 RepID=A0A495DLX4_9PROT|nr:MULTISPECIES: hypothetical protein [Maricaulis]RKR03918.1 hypothetical protein C7435_0361 [Maricaulis maris]
MRALILIMAGLSLSACATTVTDSRNGGSMANSAFNYAPSSRAPVSGAGYELIGHSDWTGRLAYYDDEGDARAHLVMRYDDGREVDARLDIVMPYLDGGLRQFRGEDQDGRYVAVELQAGPCPSADGDTLIYFADMSIGSQTASGCGREVGGEVDRWSNYLIDYLPMIDLCLSDFRDRARHVSIAYTMAGGETGVRIVDLDMRTWECATREGGTEINTIRPLDAADAMFGEGDPIFVRGAMPDFGEGCYVYEAVREADRTLIGAFGFDACNSGPIAALGPDVG